MNTSGKHQDNENDAIVLEGEETGDDEVSRNNSNKHDCVYSNSFEANIFCLINVKLDRTQVNIPFVD